MANTYTIITHAIRHPNQPLILEEPEAPAPQAQRPKTYFGVGFLWLLASVIFITVACGVVELVLAWA